ncbi:hypothetical protein BX257_4768 [Streptomyces sp. 3212.3]|uniref:hypothetical protein n=1 Tax=Streptomyces sp. 3212.3 TaxID=1938846 RepID=UPI000E245780|nr:hypothetical protein [Streptomyces sp. 3212.3]REE62155.1 hypothetical protein BX257_4768 [Streptomyces sp. 3212.3]
MSPNLVVAYAFRGAALAAIAAGGWLSSAGDWLAVTLLLWLALLLLMAGGRLHAAHTKPDRPARGQRYAKPSRAAAWDPVAAAAPEFARGFLLHLAHGQVLEGAQFPGGRVVVIDDPQWGLSTMAGSVGELLAGYGGGRVEWPDESETQA